MRLRQNYIISANKIITTVPPRPPRRSPRMSRVPFSTPRLDRRQLLKLGVGAGAASLLPLSGLQARTLSTSARIVILGGGAAGMAMANRLSNRLDGARITIVEPRETHHYQPGWTRGPPASGRPERTIRPNPTFIP